MDLFLPALPPATSVTVTHATHAHDSRTRARVHSTHSPTSRSHARCGITSSTKPAFGFKKPSSTVVTPHTRAAPRLIPHGHCRGGRTASACWVVTRFIRTMALRRRQQVSMVVRRGVPRARDKVPWSVATRTADANAWRVLLCSIAATQSSHILLLRSWRSGGVVRGRRQRERGSEKPRSRGRGAGAKEVEGPLACVRPLPSRRGRRQHHQSPRISRGALGVSGVETGGGGVRGTRASNPTTHTSTHHHGTGGTWRAHATSGFRELSGQGPLQRSPGGCSSISKPHLWRAISHGGGIWVLFGVSWLGAAARECWQCACAGFRSTRQHLTEPSGRRTGGTRHIGASCSSAHLPFTCAQTPPSSCLFIRPASAVPPQPGPPHRSRRQAAPHHPDAPSFSRAAPGSCSARTIALPPHQP